LIPIASSSYSRLSERQRIGLSTVDVRNRLGGVDYWTPDKTLAGFSSWHAPTQEHYYVDGWGNRMY
jgi:hypothetical protein